LDKLIGNRFQQVVLGVYIGTIVYAFFLLSMVSDFKDQNDIPSLSTFALIGLVIFDIFLFIYFLHYITQSVKYEVIIKRIFEVTKTQLKGLCEGKYADVENCEQTQKFTIKCNSSGVFQGLDEDETLKILDKYDCNMYFIHRSGTFLIKNQPVAYITKDLCEEEIQEISSHIYLHTSESINYNPYFGLQQLTEVAVKALSPGVNDPGTAIISLRSLLILLAYLLEHKPGNGIKDANDQTRIICQVLTFEEAFNEFLLPIWDYGKTDRLVQYEFRRVLKQLYSIKENKTLELFMETIQEQMESQKTDLTAD
ncbi:MAG: DUF2254 domain-containing protein, partial [Lentisphaeraceae bacterium]|nr:DUF2254 domain-containing protein [Lentisphaeraceae bacterium]